MPPNSPRLPRARTTWPGAAGTRRRQRHRSRRSSFRQERATAASLEHQCAAIPHCVSVHGREGPSPHRTCRCACQGKHPTVSVPAGASDRHRPRVAVRMDAALVTQAERGAPRSPVHLAPALRYTEWNAAASRILASRTAHLKQLFGAAIPRLQHFIPKRPRG